MAGAARKRDRATADSRATPRRGAFSPLTRRILAVNVLALAIVVVGMLYLDTYRHGLIDTKTTALRTQAELIAGALGESVVTGTESLLFIDAVAARQMLRRLVVPIRTRARLFDTRGDLIADSRRLPGAEREVQAEKLPTPVGAWEQKLEAVYAWIIARLPPGERLEPYVEAEEQHASQYIEVLRALAGENASALRDSGDSGIVLTVAVPVQRFKHVKAALLLSTSIDDVEESMRVVRYAILKLFAIGLAVTVLLSVFLSGTIARPIRRLAEAADAVRRGRRRSGAIPDFTARRDEIGDLSRALIDMTETLSERMDAVGRFAADVAHEIKNPLTSLRSAVETVSRVTDPEQQRELLAIVREDVQRLDRLITDISSASRLDAELAHADIEPVDVGDMLAVLVEVDRTTTAAGRASVDFDAPPGGKLVVPGVESRLVQVFQNLIANARSFSPAGGVIKITARQTGKWVEVVVEDDGPGIPPGAAENIFERFYSERPPDEKFGTHSGLGLSISKQIIDAHGGTVYAENKGGPGRSTGARFVVRLPR